MSAIEDFEKKCQSKKSKSDQERIQESSLHWFHGKPARADKGFSAIELVSGAILTVMTDNIGAVELIDTDKSYRVGVKPDAEIMMTTTTTHKLSDCDCGSNHDYGPPVSTRFDLPKVLDFPPSALGGGGVVHPGIPGYTDSCVSEGRDTQLDCWEKGGSPWNCFYRGTIARDWCELQRQRYPGTF